MKKLIVLSCLLFSIQFYGQLDTKFWFAAPEISSQHGDAPVYLHITSSEKAADVKLSLPANNTIQPLFFTVGVNETRVIDLVREFSPLELIENEIPNVISGKGIFIESSTLITAYYEVRGTHPTYGVVNTDVFTLKGKNALGKEFYTPFQKGLENFDEYLNEPFCWSSIDIVASEDGTQITITPIVDVFGHEKGVPFMIFLDKGETYSVRGLSQDASYSMSGTNIVSSKPVAVTVKDDSVRKLSGGSYDMIGDQIVPVAVLGNEYLMSEGSHYIVSTRDGNRVKVKKGTQTIKDVVLQAGETLEVQSISGINESADGVSYVTSDTSIYVFALKPIGTEYSGGLLPKINCTGSKKVSFSRSTDEEFSLEIFFKTGVGESFLLNGEGFDLVSFLETGTIPSTNEEWSYAYGSLPNGLIPPSSVLTLENTSGAFHVGVKNGSGVTGAQYGFFSNFGNLELGSDQSLCEGDEVVLDAGFGRDSYIWNTGQTSQEITIDTTGEYFVSIKEGNCKATDTIFVVFNPSISVDIGPDQIVCENDSIKLSVPIYVDRFEWSGGITDSIYWVTGTDSVYLTVYNEFSCSAKDSAAYTQVLLPKTNLSDNINVCEGNEYLIQYNSESDLYAWYEDEVLTSNLNSFTIKEEGNYQVSIQNVCGSDSTSFSLKFWDIQTPNVITPNGDGKNDTFVIEGAEGDSWDLKILNRWGKQVYHSKNYYNSWIPDLEVGTYYYFIEHQDECNVFKGWLQILK